MTRELAAQAHMTESAFRMAVHSLLVSGMTRKQAETYLTSDAVVAKLQAEIRRNRELVAGNLYRHPVLGLVTIPQE